MGLKKSVSDYNKELLIIWVAALPNNDILWQM